MAKLDITRQELIDRINMLKGMHGGFSKSSARWGNYFIGGTHISEVDLEKESDEKLIDILTGIHSGRRTA
jgi:hypothetical protein